MLNNMKIGNKIYLGFGLVLLVLAILAGTGAMSNITNKMMFGDYRNAAKETNEAGRIQANMLEARLAFRKYRAEPSPEYQQEAVERLKTTKASIDALLALTTDDSRKATIAAFHGMVDAYAAGFNTVVELQTQRNEVVNGTLDVLGPEMAEKLGGVSKALKDGGDLQTAAIVEEARYAVATMRLGTNKYLLQNDDKIHGNAVAAAKDAETALDNALKVVKDADDRARD